MKSLIKYSIWSRKISWDIAIESIGKIIQKRGFELVESGVMTFITVNPIKRLVLHTIKETIDILKKVERFDNLSFECAYILGKHSKSRASNTIELNITIDDAVTIGIKSDDYDLVEGLHSEICQELHLDNPALPVADRPLNLQPTVFVARHFDEEGNNTFAPLSTFLTLLGLDVKQGAEYSSRDIPDKVRERIDLQDIFIALVTGKRDHSWLNAEPAYAKAKGKHIILLVQEDSKYDPTILGRDLEQIRFPKASIEKCFVSLLREFRNIRVRGL